jgi:moderate conductance mechanosensitive channel
MIELATEAVWMLFRENQFMGKVLDEWVSDGQEIVHKLPHLIGIAIIGLLLNKLLRMGTRRMVRIAEHHGAGPGRIAEVKTLASVFRATGLAVIGTIVALQFLATLGMNLAPLLASAGIAGVAIGLAAQTIVKDVFNGVLILVEGQFNVGNTVTLAGLSGTVESMSLRKTTVRDGNGTLYFIPNSQITTVSNQSMDFSVATVNVSVDFSSNPDEVMELLKKVAMDVRTSDAFKDVFVSDPQVLGVDSVKGSQLIFPVVFKTLPLQQYGVIRDFHRRVRLALEEHHLLPGDPLRVYGGLAASAQGHEDAPPPTVDPTTIKPQETNPFSGE